MTLNYKFLSLVLLAGLTFEGMAAKKQRVSWNTSIEETAAVAGQSVICPQVDPFACCEDVCCGLCDSNCAIDCCQKCTQLLCFEAGLSFEQLIFPGVGSGAEPEVPSQLCSPKQANGKPICGKLQICFDKLMRKFCYRIVICGANKTFNENTKISDVFLYSKTSACEGIDNTTTFGRIPRRLIPAIFNPCEREEDPLCFSGEVTQADLECAFLNDPNAENSPETRHIACIYSQAVDGLLQVQIFGTDCVATGQAPFVRGLLRGTLRPCFPCCESKDC